MIWSVPTSVGPVSVREQIEPDDEPGLLALFAECEDWFQTVAGSPTAPGDVQSLFYSLPEGSTVDDKRLFTVRHDGEIIGLVDAVVGYPHHDACAVGFFLISPRFRRRGVGTTVARTLVDEARALGFREVTAPASEAWPPSTAFLTALGVRDRPRGPAADEPPGPARRGGGAPRDPRALSAAVSIRALSTPQDTRALRAPQARRAHPRRARSGRRRRGPSPRDAGTGLGWCDG